MSSVRLEGDAALRAQYLSEVLELLYPAGDGLGDVTQFLVIPDLRRPRLLVPANDLRLAAAAVRRYARPQSRLARLKRDAVVASLRTGTARLLLRSRVRLEPGVDTIETYLRAALRAELSVSIHIGPARANRKPVLQVLGPDGATLGFAKLGIGPLTRDLVRQETAVLTRLAGLRLADVTVPEVRHAGRWHGHEVLVQSALPVWDPRAAWSADRLAGAMLSVATGAGVSGGDLAGSRYWAALRARLAPLDAQPDGATLRRAAHDLIDRVGATRLAYGQWHGDWAPWNMATLPDTLLLWDWERCAVDVPLGFDALHYALQRDLQAAGFAVARAGGAVHHCVDAAATTLRPFGVASPDAARVTALLYLVDLAARYLADRQAEAGARLGALGTWLLPTLIRRVSHLNDRSEVAA
ncbi:hypothetical protein GCM10009682_12580 [Luedemannella flava]|uniref:Aminoglycoside phosphotransferase domain-containing protein n=1 Tax=Luedemannella flava TaxID=349316 RepID=A0ABN2LLA0_9ACTN